ncbi:Permease [Richelia intracellularis HM01]|uniref:AI-2E family transporter n=1 Tax=Richelia intracellularis TaxID=1164990 RepID=UPI0002B5A52D|nr:AI-2E family transporter [Richelia intracellularis]CCH64681.1 Permease [Richelia intracellularis HM01]
MQRWSSLQNLLVYGLSGPIIALNIWLLSELFRYFHHSITILSIAAILAFLLNYPVKFLRKVRFSRTQAIIIVLLLSLAIIIIVGITLVPIVIEQTIQLLNQIPDWLSSSQNNLEYLQAIVRRRRLPIDLNLVSNQINANIEHLVQTLASGAVGIAGTVVSTFINLVLVTVLAFYMLSYGGRVWHELINLLPVGVREPINKSFKLNFHNFFLSQLLLGLFMVVTLTPIFIILQVPFGLVLAILIGISQLIPFFGATLGIGIATLLVLLQGWWLAVQLASVSILLQQIKDNLLAPRLLSNITGLNPIWIFVAILTGFEIGGFLGALVAVPIAGTIKGTVEAVKKQKRGMDISQTIIVDNDFSSN